MIGDLIKADRSKANRVNIYKKPIYRRRWFVRLFLLCVLLVVCGVVGLILFLKPYKERADEFALENLYQLDRTSVIYDRTQSEMGSLSLENRRPVTLDEIPYEVIQALTAQEDSRFFEHNGVDYVGIGRAVWLNLKSGSITQGASTITQQLARNSFRDGLGFSRTIDRKIAEAFVAARIERHYSKAQILELYLNRIYFGSGFYGINAASIGYFSKHVSELNIQEAATLCGLIKSPNGLSPLRNPMGCREARNMCLYRMYVEKMLTEEEYQRYSNSILETRPAPSDNKSSYAFAAISQEVIEKIGSERASTGGFKIYTTIDSKVQKASEASLKKHLADVELRADYHHQTLEQFRDARRKFLEQGGTDGDRSRPKPEYLQGALIAMDNLNGDILAVVGGREFRDSNYNRALLAKRAPGTAFTPIVYGTAFENDHFPGSRIKDDPLDNRYVMIGGLTGILGEWGTEQQKTVYQGWISTREALVQGKNSATVRLGLEIGENVGESVSMVNAFAKRAGIQSAMNEYPNTFLGSSSVRLNEMCLAYSTFPNLGKRPKGLNIVQRIVDAEGKVVYSNKDREREMEVVTDPVTAYQIHSCLSQALYEGTGSKCREYGLQTAEAGGKTGTHYNFKDLWFVGYDSRITCAVWSGFDIPKTIFPGAFSNDICLPIWTDVMNASYNSTGEKPEHIAPPEGSEAVEICQRSGLRATDACYEVRQDPRTRRNIWARTIFTEHVRPGYNVNRYCDYHVDTGTDYQSLQALNRSANIQEIATNVEAVRNADAVRLKSPTIDGDDPWNSRKAQAPIDDENLAQAMPLGVEDLFPGDLETSQIPVKLTPPPTIKIDE
ncbi:MAG: membrane carboxypeptidase/penicillin-binding protein [Verrucomicrobiales bacterium]|jgi:membrane carboxypeptidase/penicillin-binding protein